jgi:hypothetical protein
VWISRARVEGIVGAHPFYFAPTLGANELRAHALQQFAGDVAFAHTNDLRIDVIRIDNVLPGSIGVTLSADHGRVFGRGVTGDDYHFDYGGGLYWSIISELGIAVSYHRGLDGSERVEAALGPLFNTTGF